MLVAGEWFLLARYAHGECDHHEAVFEGADRHSRRDPAQARSRARRVEFVVLGENDTIVLKRIRTPAMHDFDTIVARAREAARRAGLRRSDIAAAIEAVRST